MSRAAPLSGELIHDLCKIIANAFLAQAYGQLCSPPPHSSTLSDASLTQTCATIAMHSPSHRLDTIGSTDRLLSGNIMQVVKPDGSLAKEGEQGELVVTGPLMAMGYMNNEAA